MVIKREIQDRVEEKLFKGKVVIVYGPRRSGKTTLIKQIQKKYRGSLYLNCDEFSIRRALINKDSEELRVYIGNNRLVFLDEAQRVKNIGLTLKLLVDNFPEIQIVATGSSAFELSNEVVEPLTGRKHEFYLYPFSLQELSKVYSKAEIGRSLEKRMIFGSYPEVVLHEEEEALREITKSYLYKDILQYQEVKNPDVLEKLLQALALQIGNQVSYSELANLVGVDKKAVERYIQLWEKAFVIFRIKPFSRNPRKEISKLRKIYFVDIGVRNALINNLNSVDLRQDVGAIWENFLVSERIKFEKNLMRTKNYYFWRTYQQEEIDWLEEAEGKLEGFEFKWKRSKLRIPKAFSEAYPGVRVRLVNRDNYEEFVGVKSRIN